MRKTSKQMIEEFNSRLELFGQSIRVVEYSVSAIVLSSGLRLINNDRYKFCRRIMNKKTDEWIKNIDRLLAGEIKESEVKSVLAGNGGKAVQKKYGEKIKLNLNTGTPWNAGTVGLVKSWNKGLTKDTDERLAKLSQDRTGQGNPCYGKIYTSEEKIIKSQRMKENILEGKFTPNSNNRNTYWESSFLNKRYRSSWEAWYQYLSPDSEFETLRIQYEINGVMKIYIVDFVDHLNKTVAEVKPKEMTTSEIFRAKWSALLSWAESNGYEYRLVTAQWLIEHTTTIDYSLFDERTSTKIKKLYEANKKDRD